MERREKKALSLLILYFLLLKYKYAAGGKTAGKVGLTGITQFKPSSDGSVDPSLEETSESEVTARNRSFPSTVAKLQFDLFQDYNRNVRPVKNYSDAVLVAVDFTYIQVLNLNEKQQTVESLIRLRLFWKDQFLTWNPEDYDGIQKIWIPAYKTWRPDIVCMEETGKRDLNPRVPFVALNSDGTVTYLDPLSLETSCEVNIAYFPFDEQTCSLSFSSWVFPTSKLDIVARRTEEEISGDIPVFFVNLGEWNLESIKSNKMSESYLSVFTPDESSVSMTEEDLRLMTIQNYYLHPQIAVKDAVPSRVSDLHWSHVIFKLKFRRNASLYIQSMIFPAILLTTISLAGFYLPPNSGERIGLQITILLTFMVFILTVGDMFPASTGPYLGIYFVLCMALLGLNIIMTVLVLYLHHMPVTAIQKKNPATGTVSVDLDVVPYWVKFVLVLSKLYKSLSQFTVANKLDETTEQTTSKTNKPLHTSVQSILKRIAKVKVNPEEVVNEKSVSFVSYKQPIKECLDKSSQHLSSDNTTMFSNGDKLDMEQEKITDVEDFRNIDKKGPMNNCKIAKDLENVSNNISKVTAYAGIYTKKMNEASMNETMEDKWKAVARNVDMVCLKLYTFSLIICHLVILFVILFHT